MEEKNTTGANIATGCAIQAAMFVGFGLLCGSHKAIEALAWAVVLGIPAVLTRFALRKVCGLCAKRGKWLGPAFCALAILLAHNVDLDDKSEKDGKNRDATETAHAAATRQKTEKPAKSAKGAARKTAPGNEASKENALRQALAELDALTGLEGVKAEVRKLVNKEKVDAARRKQGLPVSPRSLHMVFTGNPGTGKTTVARIIARILSSLGCVPTDRFVETDRSGLVGRYMGETAAKTSAKIDEATGGVLFIDEAYQLCTSDSDDYGKEAIATLLKRMEDERGRLVVIAAGYTDEMRDFLRANSGLESRFGIKIEFADYTAKELAAIFRSTAKKNGYKLSAELEAGLDAAIEKLTRRRDKTFGNARFVRQLFEDATGRQADRVAQGGSLDAKTISTLEMEDVVPSGKTPDERAPSIEETLAELDGLTGMQSVKDEINRLVATCRANKMREEKGLEAAQMSYNFVFTGNPGTGKTTVARIVAKAFRALGILDRGHLVETDRSGLVAQYAGQTAPKTNKLFDSALGGILFIDEAYQLNQGPDDTFGQEAVATLIKRMEDERGRIVVIVAGYKDEMKRFMQINSGLESRFNRIVDFPDFSAKDLAAIFRSHAKKNKYTLSPDVERWLLPYIQMRIGQEKKSKGFGNGRWARNLFEKTVERQSLRIVAEKNPPDSELSMLRMKDVGISLKDPDASNED
ncbi:MAG: AAA family ATPase [Kiritimatiellae bacterium]|nr:AAA family ATPase [Kiritimatiellia bacterium]